MRTPHRGVSAGDQGSIVLGWLTRITLVISLLGLLGFEVLSIAVTHVQVQDIGQTAAQDAIASYQGSQNVETAYQAASAYAEGQGAQIPRKSFEVTENSATFHLNKVAPTLLLFRWDKLDRFTHVDSTIYQESLESGGQVS